jgi:hypothetical protein
MSILLILKIIVSVATALVGAYAFVRPRAVTGFTGLELPGPRGVSEVRAILGGLFIALGVAPFLYGSTGYIILGFGYALIAAARLFSIIVDKSYEQSNIISLVIEIVCGAILLI